MKNTDEIGEGGGKGGAGWKTVVKEGRSGGQEHGGVQGFLVHSRDSTRTGIHSKRNICSVDVFLSRITQKSSVNILNDLGKQGI